MDVPAASILLKQDIEAYAGRIRQSRLMTLAREGRVSYRTVGLYLCSILHLIRHTPVHLELARKCAEARNEPDLARHFEHKAHQESGHDRWAESDMAKFGPSAANGLETRPLASMVALIECVRTAIEDDPGRYLAYILFAEYLTVLVGPEWMRTLEERCGVPGSSMTVIDRHVELDKPHVLEGLREIDTLISEPARFGRLRETLELSMHHFAAFCDELAAA